MSLYDAPSGDFTPFVKYNAKAGRWFLREGETDKEVANPTFVADFANVKKAWMYFMEGQAPNIVYFPDLNAQLEQPSENHKKGISLTLFSNDSFGGVVKLESSSMNTCAAIGELHDKYEAAPESKKGQLPVIKVTGAEAVKGNYGTNYKPLFEVVKWVDRPTEFDVEVTPEASSPEPVAVAAAGDVSEF